MLAAELKKRIMNGGEISRTEALELYKQPLDLLAASADEIRSHFCGNKFDICTITNARSGKCSENCRFCAQSSFYRTGAEIYPIPDDEKIVKEAQYNASKGILRFSLVTSGKALSDIDVDRMCGIVRKIRESTDISVCISFGLLNEEQYLRLRKAGVSRVHNNIETSERFFPSVCTTHRFSDKIAAIKAAQKAGLNVCSGGIMGLGETPDDRIDMAFTLKELGVRSVPINMLNPIPGTPFENNERLTAEDMMRICAVFRFILPDASIRLAGGRGLMSDKGRGCFRSGANSAISGDMLTTSGISIDDDFDILCELGYKAVLCNE